MNKYVIKYVKSNEEFYQEISSGKHFSTVKFKEKVNYQSLLDYISLKEELNVHDWVIVGEILFLNKNRDDAKDKQIFEIAIQIANTQDSRGLNLLAKCYYFGVSVPRDESLAIKYLELAAEQDDAISLFNLWYIDFEGAKGVANPQECLEKAAELGEPESQLILGKIHLNNNDIYNAKNFFNQAYKNDLRAGKAYLTFIELGFFNIHKMPSNLMYSLRDRAETGDVEAQVEFAIQFLKGDEVKQNISYAHYWFSEASSAGSKTAKKYLDKYFHNMKIYGGNNDGRL